MDRRTAMKSLVAASLAGAAAAGSAARANVMDEGGVIKPPRLRKGQRVGIVAPASPSPEPEDVHYAADVVASLGFEPVQGEHVSDRSLYLAGTDRDRADDVNRMFGDDRIDAVFCLRGGYGTPRILPFIDYELIRANPKALIGYSDITGLLTAVHAKTGLVGFHGPIAMQNFSDYSLEEFRKVLLEPVAPVALGAAPPFESGPGKVDRDNRLTYIHGGVARGRLLGGNLTLICSLVGTAYEPDFRGRILFLEDVDEAPYRIDRMLTQLRLAGKLGEVAGIALGKFTETDTEGNSFSVEEVLRDRCGDLGVPVVRGFMFGHVEDQTTLPVGALAELDGDEGRLTLLETAVT